MNINNCNNKKRPHTCKGDKKIKETGFILVALGIMTICAFFLPIRVWLVLLAIVFIVCGIRLIR